MPRDFRLYLDDILEAVHQIRTYLADMDEEAFCADRKTHDTVIRNLEVIGEAAGNLPEQIQKAAPEIDWRKIKGLRNILIHNRRKGWCLAWRTPKSRNRLQCLTLKDRAPMTYRELERESKLEQFLKDQDESLMESYFTALDQAREKIHSVHNKADFEETVRQLDQAKRSLWEVAMATHTEFRDPPITASAMES